MIISSMSRKAPTFSQLADYIGQGSDDEVHSRFSRNLFYIGDDRKTVSGLFWDNYQTLPERKNGNALYHEIIVLEPQPHLSAKKQATILCDLAREYTERRARHQLAWGRVHFNTKYPHIHLMISANKIGSARRERLDKAAYNAIQKEMETYKEVTWPELIEQKVYTKSAPSRQRSKIKAAEGEMVRRTGRPSDKMKIAETLRTLFAHHTHIESLKSDLKRAGFSLYLRGQTWGVANIHAGQQRYRLNTLGLMGEFSRIVEQSQGRAQQQNQPQKGGSDERAKNLIRARQDMHDHAERQLEGLDGKENGERER